MSTFDGNVTEFPDVQIDNFRRDPSRPAVAFLLSHVHSDHLVGLESFKGTFIYCSLATREILLRLEKYPHRMNFAKGVLESRVQSYKHLKSVLKPIPLETPTTIELSPGRIIRVTLFDANHCVGAVMFLVEGDGKAILYTGDIRSESWWVDSLTRNPILIPYVFEQNKEPIRRLDNIYLDTTFATKSNKYRHFPSKADGVSELLRKVSDYPKDTKFYFDSWTFGYEEVWQALSNLLDTQVHVDDYRFRLYSALASTISNQGRPPEASKLVGSSCGNHYQEGCLTTKQARLHSCERGTGCEIWNQDYVRITPIVSRFNGSDMAELGTGGGQGDLDQQHTLDLGDVSANQNLISLCADRLQGDSELLTKVKRMLESAMQDSRKKICIEHVNAQADADQVPIGELVPALARKVVRSQPLPTTAAVGPSEASGTLPRHITFPYSRHSSYRELCLLIGAFRPREIHPCTVVDRRDWDWTRSMMHLFGHLYDGEFQDSNMFGHDRMMMEDRPKESRRQEDSSAVMDATDTTSSPSSGRLSNGDMHDGVTIGDQNDPIGIFLASSQTMMQSHGHPDQSLRQHHARLRNTLRHDAYNAALGHTSTWFDIGLVSVHGHREKEEEL